MRMKQRWFALLCSLMIGMGISVIIVTTSVRASELAADFNLAVSLRAPQHIAPGSTFELNLIYSNTGTTASPSDTQVELTLPSSVTFQSATDRTGASFDPASQAGSVITWQLGSLKPGEEGHIFVGLLADEALVEESPLTFQAEISAVEMDADPSDNLDTLTSTVCDMAGSGVQAHTRQGMPLDVITYTVRLEFAHRNQAGAPQQRQIDLDIDLPESQVKFLGWAGSNTGNKVGTALRWQGQVRSGEPLVLQYRLGILEDVQPGAVISQQVRMRWDTGELSLDPVNIPITLPNQARLVEPQGYTWRHQNGVEVQIPANAVTETTRFQFQPLITTTETISAPVGYRFAHQAFELTAFRFGEVHQFNQPITLTVPVTPALESGLRRETLRLWYRNGPWEPWAMLGEPAQMNANSFSFTTTHFTEFALFGESTLQRILLPFINR